RTAGRRAADPPRRPRDDLHVPLAPFAPPRCVPGRPRRRRGGDVHDVRSAGVDRPGDRHDQPDAREESMRVDPVTLNIVGKALIAIAREMAANMRRASYSTVVREARDFSVGVLDPAGNVVAQAEMI